MPFCKEVCGKWNGYLEQGEEINHSELNKIIYKTGKNTSVLEYMKYCHTLSECIRRTHILCLLWAQCCISCTAFI